MKEMRSTLVFLASTAFLGCGNDPLTGTWVNSTATPPAGASSFTLSLDFQSGKKITATIVTVFENAAPEFPGCTRTVVTTGSYAETTASSTVALTYTAGTTASAKCLNPSDENDPVPLSATFLSGQNQTFTYGVASVAGSPLTLTLTTTTTPSSSLAYTKK